MIRAIIWKEWREHRMKYVAYWLVLNAPILLVAFAVGLSSAMRTPFLDLNNTVLKYLPLALFEPLMLATAFLLIAGYLAVATFTPEIEDGSLFFVYEQPLSRRRYVAMKLLIGGFHVVAAVCFATLFATVAAYGMMLAGGRVTWAGTGDAFTAVLAASARATVWCSLISLVGFTSSALVAVVAPRRWMALAGSTVVTVLLIVAGGNLFDLTADVPSGDPMSVGMGFSSGSWQWLTVSRAVHLSEVRGFAHWRALPLSIAVMLTGVFSVAIAQLYGRKELK